MVESRGGGGTWFQIVLGAQQLNVAVGHYDAEHHRNILNLVKI